MVALLAVVCFSRQTPLKLNPLFSDGMVLQRGRVDPVFGTAAPGQPVSVQIGNQTYGATADATGHWKTDIQPLAPGGPYTLTVSSGNDKIAVNDVAVGEVWIAGGQSNMEFAEADASDYIQAQAEANPDVRIFRVRKIASDTPLTEVQGSWSVAADMTVGKMSAVGLAFARELANKLRMPVGVIDTSWGGTPVESWTSMGALQKEPAIHDTLQQYLDDLRTYPERKAAYDQAMQIWVEGKNGSDNQGYQNGWALPEYSDASWKTVPAGSLVESIVGREFDGSFWYRTTINLPDEWYGKQLRLQLGALDDYDSTYFNGIRVGRTDQKTPDAFSVERVYTVAPGIVRKGPNTIAIRVFNVEGSGGMRGPLEDMRIGPSDDSTTLPLTGDWKFKEEQELDPNAPRPHLPAGPGDPMSPGELYNGIIAPLLAYPIRGAIWYQGEANVGKADQYTKLFPDMIRDWRAKWRQPFPFYYVQLANYLQRKPDPGDSDWAALREAQAVALSLPNTGMAVTIDVGEADTIHPKNKREVGRRLSLWALGNTYHIPTVYGSPLYQSMQVDGNTVKVTFSNGSLITSDGAAPKGFALAGDDKKFYWAQASIDGSNVVLTCPQVAHPVAIRYAWADNPDVNLTNRAGLPACPFRTDTWTANQ